MHRFNSHFELNYKFSNTVKGVEWVILSSNNSDKKLKKIVDVCNLSKTATSKGGNLFSVREGWNNNEDNSFGKWGEKTCRLY